MSYRILRVGGSRIGHWSWAVFGAAGCLLGCEEVPGVGSGDAGPDAAVGHVSVPPAAGSVSDSDVASSGEGTRTINVDLDNQNTMDDVLSVDLGVGHGDSDAGSVEGGVVGTIVNPSDAGPTGSTTGDPSAFGASTETTGGTGATGGTGSGIVIPVDPTSTSPNETTNDVPTSTSAEWDPTSSDVFPSSDAPSTGSGPAPSSSGETTSDAPYLTSTEAPSSSADETTDEPPPLFPGTLSGFGDWVDLPATFSASVDVGANRARFVWELLSTPPGSELNTGNLESPTSSQTTFYPDVAGKYTARVTLTVADANYVGEVSLEVAAVEVGFISIVQSTSDLVYTHSPQMVRSDRPGAPRDVGCGFKSDPEENWYNELGDGRNRTFGFKYPRLPSDTTFFAYRMAQRQRLEATSQVATPESDCGQRAPKDLPVMWTPSFSPEGKQVAFARATTTPNGTDYSVVRIAIDGSDEAALAKAFDLVSVAWWEPATWQREAVVWLGAQEQGKYGLGVVNPNPPTTSGWMMDCSATPRGSDWTDFKMGPDFVLGNSYGDWWYMPVTFDAEGPSAWCDAEAAKLLPGPVYDVAVSADGKMLAMITLSYRSDQTPSVALEIGPAGTLFSDRTEWVSVSLDSELEYTGLHWIAGNKQVAFTALDVLYTESQGVEVYDSSIWRANWDGKQMKELARATPASRTTRHVVTTGPLQSSRYTLTPIDEM